MRSIRAARLRWVVPFVASSALLVGATQVASAQGAITGRVGSGANEAPHAAVKKVPHIAFLGFATDNSFAQATWKGVRKAAKKYGGSATFLNGDFSASTQVSQLETETTSSRYNIFVIQANDGSAVVPQVKAAIKKGIVVVAEFTQVGTSYSKIAPQVPGEISIVEDSVLNGTDLGKLAIGACAKLATCNVVYYQGDTSLPLDVARTKAVLAELKSDPHVKLLEDPQGGYLQSTGETVTEDVLSAHPDVNVIVGSSQAIEGATIVLKDHHLLGKVKLIGNGGSTQAVNYVKAGTWYATYGIPEVTDGYDAALYGIEKLEGGSPPTAVNSAALGPAKGMWTQSVVKKYGIVGQYAD